MNKYDMYCRLKQATQRCVDDAQRLVVDEIPEEIVYRVQLGMDVLGDMTAENLIDLIWVEEKTRRWVNLGVKTIEDSKTIFYTALSKDFMDYDELVSLSRNPLTPFVLHLPKFPKGWRINNKYGLGDLEESLRVHGKYELVRR